MVNSKIESAIEFFKKNDYQNALDSFKEALKSDSENSNIINNIALCEMKLGKYDDAESNFLNAIEINEDVPQPYLNLAELYFLQKEFMKAIDLLQRAAIIMPDNVAILHYLGRIYIEDKRYNEAIDALNMVIELSPENADAYWDLGMVYYDLGEYDLSSKNFENVLEKNENSAIIYYQTGLSYEMQNDIDKAISNHLKALMVDENFPLSYKRLGMLYLARKEYSDAIEYFEDYLKFDLTKEEKNTIQKNIDRLKALK